MKQIPMQFPYGAVYFRKSNPPPEDWARDYRQAADDGMNIFRHWFLWSSIEVAPGEYDWADYDRQMDLAAEHGIKVIIAEISTAVPEWLHYARPDLLCETADGRRPDSGFSASSATGGFCSGLCLDKEEGRALTAGFLTSLAARYKNHPALLGYDVWNECSIPHELCYCADTERAFQAWLRKKYGELDALRRAWFRYSYTAWEQVRAPRSLTMAPECIDWLTFRKENAYRGMQFRIDMLRAVDDESLICAHGRGYALQDMALGASDEWESGKRVDVYGLTYVQARQGNDAWKHFDFVDLTRSGAKEKPIWHAETYGGPLWFQRQLPGRPREDGRISEPEDIRIWNLTSMACGVRGIMHTRWRPLLDGPLFGAFGAYGMDGLLTPRSQMASRMARWANVPEQKALWAAAPVRGEIGIVVVPEAQIASLLLSKGGGMQDRYSEIVYGAYRGFFDRNIQADWVHINDIDRYDALYLPYPIQLRETHARRLTEWVRRGGRLFCEGCPAYFGDLGHVNPIQPAFGLDGLFGARQENVEFMPDIFDRLSLTFSGSRIYGGEYLQSYRVTAGKACGRLDNGDVIAVENQFGNGRTILVGTCVSAGYMRNLDGATGRFFHDLLQRLGVTQHARVDNPAIKVRLHESSEGLFVWMINYTRTTQKVRCKISEGWDKNRIRQIFWQGGTLSAVGPNEYEAEIEGRNAIVFSLR